MYVLDFDDVSQNLKKYFIVARGGGDEGTAWSYNNQGKSWIVDEEKMPKPFFASPADNFFYLADREPDSRTSKRNIIHLTCRTQSRFIT